jgi:hypothetical protein
LKPGRRCQAVHLRYCRYGQIAQGETQFGELVEYESMVVSALLRGQLFEVVAFLEEGNFFFLIY